MTASITTLETKVAHLETKIDKLLQLSTAKRTNTYDRNSEHYCWSHDRTYNSSHTSRTCRTQKTDHKKDATLHNRMGGSNLQCGTSDAV